MSAVLKRLAKRWETRSIVSKTSIVVVSAISLYLIVVVAFQRSPAIEGAVLDADTGQPIPGAVVLKAAYGPTPIPSENPGGSLSGGGVYKSVTDDAGHFRFPEELVSVLPLSMIDTIDLRVWQPDYIGALSNMEGFWWRQETPKRSGGYCKVVRHRDWIGRFSYTICLKKATTKEQWQTKIGSTNLGTDKAAEEERLFCDLVGYLEQWPETPYQEARLPLFLGPYAQADFSDNSWHLDCKRLRESTPAERDTFLRHFQFLGTWLEANLKANNIPPEEALKLTHFQPSADSTQFAGRLMWDYQEWTKYQSEVTACLRSIP